MRKHFWITACLVFAVSASLFGQEVPEKKLDTLTRDDTDVMKELFKFPGIPTEPFARKAPNVKRNDTIKIFSLSPIHRRVKRVDGMALGVGHYENERIEFQQVNGFNIEASPLPLALMTFALNAPFELLVVGINDNSVSNVAFMDEEVDTYIKVNGINLSSGGFMGGAQMNGLNISTITAMNAMNGFSFSAVANGSKKFNGINVAGIANVSYEGNGLQVAVSNVSRKHRGIQIGLFNNSKNLRGFQFGLWNTNGKRKLPFINWQFKG